MYVLDAILDGDAMERMKLMMEVRPSLRMASIFMAASAGLRRGPQGCSFWKAIAKPCGLFMKAFSIWLCTSSKCKGIWMERRTRGAKWKERVHSMRGRAPYAETGT